MLQGEMRVARLRAQYPAALLAAYDAAARAICRTLEMPIRYAGPGEWTVFARPLPYAALPRPVAAVPGTRPDDVCVVITAALWGTFQELSLYLEALCIHAWCLFTEGLQWEGSAPGERGLVYRLLTERPDNRRPLSWERNQVDLLLMEGHVFRCPWTLREIRQAGAYDLDHLVPLAVYPCNELWNLAPADAQFNQRVKRDRLPSPVRLAGARPTLARALEADVGSRFAQLAQPGQARPARIVGAVVDLMEYIGQTRNVARFA